MYLAKELCVMKLMETVAQFGTGSMPRRLGH